MTRKHDSGGRNKTWEKYMDQLWSIRWNYELQQLSVHKGLTWNIPWWKKAKVWRGVAEDRNERERALHDNDVCVCLFLQSI